MMTLAPNTKNLKLVLAAAALGAGMIASSAPAEARFVGFGGFHRFGMMRPAFAPRPFFARPAVFVNRPFFVHRPFFHRRHFFGPFAAGLVTGAAVGAFGAAYPAYYPAYYNAAYGDECFVIRRKFIDPWGGLVIRRKLVCY